MIKPIEHIINIDLANKININQSINIKKNDTDSHKFIINLFNNSLTYDLTGATSRIYFQKADSTKVFLDCILDVALTGKLSCLLTNQVLTSPGQVESEITIYGTAGEILTSVTFNFTVSEVIRDDMAIESTSEFTALTNALVKIDTAVENIGTIDSLNTILEGNIGTGDALDVTLKGDIATGNITDTNVKASTILANASDVTLKADIIIAGQNEFATEITSARKGEVDLGTKIGKLDSSLAKNVQQSKLMLDKDIFAEIIDMHYDTLKGLGWNVLESGGEITKNITVSALKNTYDLTLDSTTSLYVNQLIVIFTNGEYYSNIIKNIVGNVVTFNYPLKTDISINDILYNFYINSTHANIYGFRTVADEAIRSIVKPRGYKLLQRILPSEFTYSTGTTVTDGGFKQDYTEPFSTFDTKVVTVTVDQVKSAIKEFTIEQDRYLKFKTYVKLSDILTLNYQISNVANSVTFINKNVTLSGYGNTAVIETMVFLRKGSYNLKMRLMTTPGSFAFGKTEMFELSTKYNYQSFNKGIHVCLGDSWFEIEGVLERLAQRFPLATFINFGVGGNKSDALIRRFTGTATDADIKDDFATYGDRIDATLIPKIDYVWVICGTNDYNGSVTNDVFKTNIDTLVSAIIDRGAKPLIFNSSVGQIGIATNFTLSRQYADIYYNQQYSVDSSIITSLGVEEGLFVPIIIGSTTVGANTYDVQEGIYKKIGKTVTFALRVRMSTKDVSIAGLIKIIGLPYNPIRISALALSRADYVLYGATGRQIVAQAETNGEIIINKIIDNGSILAVVASDVANNTMFYITGAYPIL